MMREVSADEVLGGAPNAARPPEWVMEIVEDWCERLFLHIWSIAVGMVEVDERLGEVAITPHSLHARIHLNPCDLDNKERLEMTIIHELLHIVHGRVDHFVEGRMLAHFSESLRKENLSTYRDNMEPFIETMARVLYMSKCKEADGEEEPPVEPKSPIVLEGLELASEAEEGSR